MLGLLIKDFLTVKQQLRIMLLLLIFYLIFGITTNNSSALWTMFMVISAMLPITTMAYDEKANWDKYALSLPVSRKTIVLSKYLFGIILTLLSMIIAIPFTALMAYLSPEIEISILTTIVSIGDIIPIFLAVVLPIFFKFGTEKGRFVMMIVFFIPVLVIIYLAKTFGTNLDEFPLFRPEILEILPYALPVLAFLLLLVSYRISLRIYCHKEF